MEPDRIVESASYGICDERSGHFVDAAVHVDLDRRGRDFRGAFRVLAERALVLGRGAFRL